MRHAGGDGHLLDHVAELRLLVVGDAPGAAHGQDHLVAAVVADDAPDDGDDAEDAEQADAARGAVQRREADGEAEREDGHDEPASSQEAGGCCAICSYMMPCGLAPAGLPQVDRRDLAVGLGPRRTGAS